MKAINLNLETNFCEGIKQIIIVYMKNVRFETWEAEYKLTNQITERSAGKFLLHRTIQNLVNMLNSKRT